jgi:hypothetical protein
MTQLPGMAGCCTRKLDAALRAIDFLLGFRFTLLCVGLTQSHGLSFADDAWFAIIAKSPCLTGMIDGCLFNTCSLEGESITTIAA